MFLGHYAVAIGAKRVAPRTSLGTLIAAAAFLDLVWPVLVLAGVERVVVAPGATAFTPLDFQYYPISHSLMMSIIWGAAFGGAYFLVRRDKRAAVVLGLLVVSHWFLDAVVHRPDLPLTLGGAARVGFGLWGSIAGTLAVELAMFATALWMYLEATRPRDQIGSIGIVAFAVFVLVIYAGAAFGPPPPSATVIAWSDMGQWLVIALAAWVDAHRSPLL
jgi:hypothetical protein